MLATSISSFFQQCFLSFPKQSSIFVISLLLLQIFTDIQRAIHTIKGDNSKCNNLWTFFNLDFLFSIKYPTAEHWHLHAVLLFSLQMLSVWTGRKIIVGKELCILFQNDSCPIHVASQGKPDIVDLLIANNCDVNAKDGV